jgi:hypothetical protein
MNIVDTDKVIFNLDWSTRHLKNLQKQCPYTNEHHYEAIYMFGIMKSSCELLKINVLQWCKSVNLPYKRREEGYEQLFRAEKPYNILGKPMQKTVHYNDLIDKLKWTDKPAMTYLK